MKELIDACDFTMGQSPDSTSYNKNRNGLPFYQGNADFGTINPVPQWWCNAPKKTAKSGDILISVRAPIGALNIANEDCCIGRGLAALTPKEGICELDYLYLYLKSVSNRINDLGTGSTFKAITTARLTTFKIPLPSIDTQRFIAAKLKKQMTAIDEILRDIDRQITDVDAFVERQISDAICSSVGSDWTEGLVEEFAEVNPSVKGISKKPDDDDEVPFVPMPAVSAEEGRITEQIVKKYSEVRKGYTYFEEGDILFAKITPCMQNGKIAIAENLVSKIGFGSTEFHVIRVDEHLIPEWLFYHFRRKSYLMEAVGKMQGAVGQQRLPDAFIRKTQIAFPSSLDAQREIVKNLQGQVDRASELKHDLNKQKKNVIALREAYYRESFESEAQE